MILKLNIHNAPLQVLINIHQCAHIFTQKELIMMFIRSIQYKYNTFLTKTQKITNMFFFQVEVLHDPIPISLTTQPQ